MSLSLQREFIGAVASKLSFGTEGYPEKVARRLRAINFASWSFALFCVGFAIYDLTDPKLWTVAAINLVFALIFVAIPLLHRFGSLAAAIALLIVGYTGIFILCSMLGTDSGMQVLYISGAALVILAFGVDHVVLAASSAVISVLLIIVLEIWAPRDPGLLSEGAMLGNFIACVAGTCAILFAVVFYVVRGVARAEEIAEREHERSEALLTNILPPSIAQRLKEHGSTIVADKFDEASILFADMAGFTAQASEVSAQELVYFLNDVYLTFDRLVEIRGLEKIKTTGDSYMVVSGVPVVRPDHAKALAHLALDMQSAALKLSDTRGRELSIRIGMASGPVVAGVIGYRKFFYDVWGDAVNVASRMESTGLPGRIQVSELTCSLLQSTFVLEARGEIDVKGKGEMPTWFLLAAKPD